VNLVLHPASITRGLESTGPKLTHFVPCSSVSTGRFPLRFVFFYSVSESEAGFEARFCSRVENRPVEAQGNAGSRRLQDCDYQKAPNYRIEASVECLEGC